MTCSPMGGKLDGAVDPMGYGANQPSRPCMLLAHIVPELIEEPPRSDYFLLRVSGAYFSNDAGIDDASSRRNFQKPSNDNLRIIISGGHFRILP